MTPAAEAAEAAEPGSQGLRGRSGLLIAGAFFSASLLGFVLLGVVSRWLSQEQNAQFLALWGLVFGIGSALSAVEQEIVRLATNAHIDGTRVPGRALQVTGLAIAVAVLAVGVIAFLPGVGELLRQSLLVAALVFVATGGFAVQCLSRAVLLGTNQVVAYVSVVPKGSKIRGYEIYADAVLTAQLTQATIVSLKAGSDECRSRRARSSQYSRL